MRNVTLRILGGTQRGRVLFQGPLSPLTRPTTERLRKTLFDLLEHTPALRFQTLKESTVLDACAGTGAWGWEALSRGAAHVFFWDTAPQAIKNLHNTAKTLEMEALCRIHACDVNHPPHAPYAVNYLFLDPPYADTHIRTKLQILEAAGWINAKTCIVIEHAHTTPVEDSNIWTIHVQRQHKFRVLSIGRRSY